MLVWQQLLEDEFWRCSVERAVEKIVKDSSELAKHKIISARIS